MADRVQQIDDNGRTINSNEACLLKSTWTFVTTTTGATGAHTLFTVTGTVLVNVFGICDTSLTGAATFEVGTANNTAAIVAQIANATTLDDGDVYVDADTAAEVAALPSVKVINDGADIILTIGSTAVTAGVVDFYCLWRPLSSGSSVTVTTPA